MDGADSQPVSAMLMLAACLPGSTEIEVHNPGEKPWIDLILYWLDRLGVHYEHRDYAWYRVDGRTPWQGFDCTILGDWSSAAFPLAGALVTNSAITLRNMDINDPQGDKAVLELFRRMGANIEVDEAAKTVTVYPHNGLNGIEVDVNAAIAAVPILATMACFAKKPTRITGAAIARQKESDRISAITAELGKMGAKIDEFQDGMTVYPVELRGAETESRHDHRIAMSLAVAGLACGGTTVNDTDCVSKSFPGFARAMQGIGAHINEVESL